MARATPAQSCTGRRRAEVLAALGGPEKSVPWEALYGRIEAARAAGDAGFLVELLAAVYPARESGRQWSRAKNLALVAFRALATIPPGLFS